jgi:hypothetical protein
MSQNYHMLNLQKLLFMIEELHKRGYESLKAIPSLSPSGASWRLELFNADWSQRESASKWLECNFKIEKEEITESNVELADLFSLRRLPKIPIIIVVRKSIRQFFLI